MGRLRRERARALRRSPTEAERRLWYALRRRRFDGHKFRRQQPLGPYFVDFFCIEAQLVVEVDGNHHAEQQGYDRDRDEWLARRGLRVLRFSDRDVLTRLGDVEEAIWIALTGIRNPPPNS